MAYDQCNEVATARALGLSQGAANELLPLFADSGSADVRKKAWLDHLVGRFADAVNEQPGDSGNRLAANLFWDACRQAATEHGYENWFNAANLDETEQALLRFVQGDSATW